MGDHLEVDPSVLIQAAQGITAITESLSGLGTGETASVGRGFSLLALSPMEAGKQEVQTSLEEFAERWSWGVRHLVQSANEIARVLDLAAGSYYTTEQVYSDALKTVWTNTVGNPHLSGDEISDRTSGETLADNPINQTLNYTPLTQAVSRTSDIDRLSDQRAVDTEFYAIVTDLVGTPVELVDPRTVDRVADATTDLWGNTTWHGATDTPLRFPGQYHDPETGLHYNLHRYYNPDTSPRTRSDSPPHPTRTPTPTTPPDGPTHSAWCRVRPKQSMGRTGSRCPQFSPEPWARRWILARDCSTQFLQTHRDWTRASRQYELWTLSRLLAGVIPMAMPYTRTLLGKP
ncbi:hypothetical protein R1CP_00230 [Rhodococcus opacus]|uniref:Uncharacterized protein n=1 Tax=Rhodococcus opacus TaxID=37919 RepID=A0A1B1JWS8_RHOOP|nr:RHS repeat-associated core domain-containing protein [Rhodococcus opacus]ANS24806.1 hypothetical protein R1CP_00230 [Rhodococcus opacus]